MKAALDGDWIDEANVCLDALCWLARIESDGKPDQERAITKEERDAVVYVILGTPDRADRAG